MAAALEMDLAVAVLIILAELVVTLEEMVVLTLVVAAAVVAVKLALTVDLVDLEWLLFVTHTFDRRK